MDLASCAAGTVELDAHTGTFSQRLSLPVLQSACCVILLFRTGGWISIIRPTGQLGVRECSGAEQGPLYPDSLKLLSGTLKQDKHRRSLCLRCSNAHAVRIPLHQLPLWRRDRFHHPRRQPAGRRPRAAGVQRHPLEESCKSGPLQLQHVQAVVVHLGRRIVMPAHYNGAWSAAGQPVSAS